MLNKSLFIGTFFLLFIGLSDYGYGCHEGEKHKAPNLPCGGGPGGGGDKVVGEYIVTIYDEVTNGPWSGHANEKSVDGRDLPNFIDVNFFLDLFDSIDAHNQTDGENCFLSLDDPPVYFGSLQRKPGDTAYGQFWFPGCTTDGLDGGGVDCVQEVLYQLQIFGDFANGFSVMPLNPGESALMEMKDWILQISPGGLNIQMDSCLAESEPPDVVNPEFPRFDPGEVEILVERCPDDVGGLCP